MILLNVICVTNTKTPAAEERARRLAEALRNNLRKRKEQSREDKAKTESEPES